MIDQTTGRATRVNFQPLPLEMILRSSRRHRPLLVGYLLNALVDAAHRLWDEFEPAEEPEPHATLNGYPLAPRDIPKSPFLPRWRRREGDR